MSTDDLLGPFNKAVCKNAMRWVKTVKVIVLLNRFSVEESRRSIQITFVSCILFVFIFILAQAIFCILVKLLSPNIFEK